MADTKQTPKGAIRKILEGVAGILGDEHDVAKGLETIADNVEDLVRFTKTVPIAKVDTERRLVYGVVYEPNVPDAHDDVMTVDEIEKACHRFTQNYAQSRGETGLEHLDDVGRDQVTVAECYLAPVDFKLGKQLVTKGSWVLVTKVHDDQIWADVKTGKYTGYSFEGWGRRVPAPA